MAYLPTLAEPRRSALNALTRRARSVLLPGDSESLTVPLALPGRTGSGAVTSFWCLVG